MKHLARRTRALTAPITLILGWAAQAIGQVAAPAPTGLAESPPPVSSAPAPETADGAPELPSGQIPPATEPQPTGSEPVPEGPSEEPELESAPPETAPPKKEQPRTKKAPIYEPPLPDLDDPDALYPGFVPESHRSPYTSIWLGARGGWLSPQGSLWIDGAPQGNACCVFQRRRFADFASSGPSFEVDLGARLARHYNVFGTWEFTSLGAGSLLNNDLGGQKRGIMHFVAAGLRFSSDPDDYGFLFEVNLGIKHFQAEWDTGDQLRADDEFLSMRVGIGADIRVTDDFALSPLLTFASGTFSDVRWRYRDGTSEPALTALDDFGQHGAISLAVGAHYDLLRFRD